MDIEQLLPHVEALIFASERPLTQMEVTELAGQALEEEPGTERVATCIAAIMEKYSAEYYPFHLVETGGGYQFLTKKAYHKTVIKLSGEKHLKKLSSAAMETLSIIAYKQPVTKGEIEFIRGVSADYSIQKLLEKELIIITGRNEDMVGKPLMYATSKFFLDYLGINGPHQLPRIKEIADMETIIPVSGREAIPADIAAGGFEVMRQAS